MQDYMTLGSTPYEEECYPVGHPLSRIETQVYVRQLRRHFPEARLSVRSCPHDFGTYYEAQVKYELDDQEDSQRAYNIESDLPGNWDDEAKAELKSIQKNYEE